MSPITEQLQALIEKAIQEAKDTHPVKGFYDDLKTITFSKDMNMLELDILLASIQTAIMHRFIIEWHIEEIAQ